MEFRITTADGMQHELEAGGLDNAIDAVTELGCPLEHITSAWYFNSVYGHWMSGDNLLKAFKAAKNSEESL